MSFPGPTAVAAPLMLAAAIAIRLEDDGRAFYISERIGRNDQPFRMFKLRSMKQIAQAVQAGIGYAYKFDSNDDLTMVGRLIRRMGK